MQTSVKVLIVEDEPHALMGLAELISGWGYRTETARDGIEGWEKALAFEPRHRRHRPQDAAPRRHSACWPSLPKKAPASDPTSPWSC